MNKTSIANCIRDAIDCDSKTAKRIAAKLHAENYDVTCASLDDFKRKLRAMLIDEMQANLDAALRRDAGSMKWCAGIGTPYELQIGEDSRECATLAEARGYIIGRMDAMAMELEKAAHQRGSRTASQAGRCYRLIAEHIACMSVADIGDGWTANEENSELGAGWTVYIARF